MVCLRDKGKFHRDDVRMQKETKQILANVQQLIGYGPISGAFHNNLVQMPNIAGAALPSPQVVGDMGSELGDPTADRLI